MRRTRLTVATFLLGIVGIHQALAAGTSQDFNKWEKEISTFEQADATNPPPKEAILFIGSSTIRGWKSLAKDFPQHRVINRGFGGSEVADATHFADRIVFPYAPRAIFFRAGGNDIAAGKTPAQVFADFKQFVDTIHTRLPRTEIFFISWSPTPLRWTNREKEKIFNDLVRGWCAQNEHLKYVEASEFVLGANGQPRTELFKSDKLHFNAEGYKLLAEIVRPFLPQEPARSSETR